jgi:hypothetical protein
VLQCCVVGTTFLIFDLWLWPVLYQEIQTLQDIRFNCKRWKHKFRKNGPKQTVAQLCSFISVDMVYLKRNRCFLGLSIFDGQLLVIPIFLQQDFSQQRAIKFSSIYAICCLLLKYSSQEALSLFFSKNPTS